MSLKDLQEFTELATSASKQDANLPSVATNDSPRRPRKRRSEDENSGDVTQYAQSAGGFIPTSSTTAKLPADCYTLSMTMEGNVVFIPQRIVTDELMRLPDSKSDEVVAEVERFWTLKDRFDTYGFAHKRGFLLWGPPGSGKTSTVAIIINDMIKKGGIVLLADHPGILSKALMQLRTVEPERPLVVILEDLDTIIAMHGEASVLSILDGESQVENVVFLATTNYPENLDGRVINRPSRFDKIVKIGMPNAEARRMYITAKLGVTEKEGFDLVKETEDLSIAHIKELIISVFCQDNAVGEVLTRLKAMKKTPTSAGDRAPLGFGLAGR